MAITFNTSDIGTVKFNTAELSSVRYNGTEVWSRAELVDYTFPNATAELTENGDYGMVTFYDSRNRVEHDPVYAFDNTLDNGYAKYTSTQNQGRIGICLPFPIQLQSITIANAASSTVTGKPAGAGALLTANVHVSADESRTSIFDASSGNDVLLWATIERQNATAYSAETEHFPTDEAMTKEWIRSICINSLSWSSSWHVIGEVTLKFKAKSTDLVAAGLL